MLGNYYTLHNIYFFLNLYMKIFQQICISSSIHFNSHNNLDVVFIVKSEKIIINTYKTFSSYII